MKYDKKTTLIGYLYIATASDSGKSMYLEDTNSARHLTSNSTFHQNVEVFSKKEQGQVIGTYVCIQKHNYSCVFDYIHIYQ